MNENNSDMDRLQGESFEERRERTRAERLADLHAKMRGRQAEYGEALLEALGTSFEITPGDEATLAEAIKRLDGERQRPYARGAAIIALLESSFFDSVYSFYVMADKESKAIADELTGGGFEAFKEIEKKLYADGDKVLDALAARKIPTDGEIDKYRYPAVNKYLPSVTPDMFGEAYFDYIQPRDEEVKDVLIVSAGQNVAAFEKYAHNGYVLEMDEDALQHLVYRAQDGGEAIVDPYGTLRAFASCCWHVITSLLESPQAGEAVRGIVYPKRKPYTNVDKLVVANSAADKKMRATPWQYLDGTAQIIKTGKGGMYEQMLLFNAEAANDKLSEEYRASRAITFRDQYYLNLLYSVAESNPNNPKIALSDVLKMAGIKNPKDPDNIPRYQEAYESVHKARTTEATLIVDGEASHYAKKGRKVTNIRQENIIYAAQDSYVYEGYDVRDEDGHMVVMRDTNGNPVSFDSYVELKAEPGRLLDALPMLRHAKETGNILAGEAARLLRFETTIKDGKKIEGVTIKQDMRVVMFCILTRYLEQGTSNTIKYDTLMRDLDMLTGDARKDADKRQRMHKKVMECLEYWKKIDIIEDYEVIKNARGKIEGVKLIRPKEQKKLDGSKN